MSKLIPLSLISIFVLIALPAMAQDAPKRHAMIVELAPQAVSESPQLNLDRLRAITAVAGAIDVEARTMFDFEGSNADLAVRLPAGRLRTFGRWMRLESDSPEELAYTVDMLRAAGTIRTAYRAPRPVPATINDPQPALLDVDDLLSLQGYLLPSPVGMNVLAAWLRLADSNQRVVFADVEGAWNKNHFDLPLWRKRVAGLPMPVDSSWFSHGTAVVGIVAGKDNNGGITGIAPASKVRLYSVFRKENNRIYDNVTATLLRAAEELKKGSVLLIEVQYDNVEGVPSFVPVEYFTPEFEAIKYLIERGIIVVEVAGNGGLNLDEYLVEDGVIPDSGAIMVGAGGVPNRFNQSGAGDNLRRLWFSNYGKRVDVQNWGEHVVTTGYGDLAEGPSLRNHSYTSTFNGTSSAAALTAGAVVLIQQYALTELGRPLTMTEIRSILVETGTPQRGPAAKEPIGPRPNLEKAFDRVDALK